MTTRILLADDHALVRRGLRPILDGEPDLRVVAEAGDGAEAVEKVAGGGVDLAILDIAMPYVLKSVADQDLVASTPTTCSTPVTAGSRP